MNEAGGWEVGGIISLLRALLMATVLDFVRCKNLQIFHANVKMGKEGKRVKMSNIILFLTSTIEARRKIGLSLSYLCKLSKHRTIIYIHLPITLELAVALLLLGKHMHLL